MKFAHLADIHIGAWRDPAMKGLSMEAFRKAVSVIIEKKLDFVIIAGDFFNTAVPAIDHLQEVVSLLKKLRENRIPVYIVPGSHDYSASGKTILDVLDEAELLTSIMKGRVEGGKLVLDFTVDKGTGAKLAGLGGRRGSLEQREYNALDLASLEQEQGFKIFVFHSSIDELKADEMYLMQSIKIDDLPKGFDYYAGGHVHAVQQKDCEDRKNIAYPGPLFPANFQEIWQLGRGGFFIYDNGHIEHYPLNIKNIHRIDADAEERSPEEVFQDIGSMLKLREFNNTIVLLRAHGRLRSGRPSDIDFKGIVKEIYNKSAYFVMRSTSQLSSKEFAEVKSSPGSSEDLENEIIAENLAGKGMFSRGDCDVAKDLIHAFSDEQNDGEKKHEYDSRVKRDADKILEP
jgi:DNA repair protein SbcD/Mre11